MSGELLRQLVRARQLEPGTGRPEYRGRVAAERLGSRLSDRIERLLLGQRLAQHSRDPVEAALDLRLPRALLVRLGVPERNRGEARERLDQAQVRLLEATGLARADAEDAADLAEGEDRRIHHLCERRVAARGRRLLGLGELAPQHRLAGGDRVADRAGNRNRAADLLLGEPEHGAADELGAAGEERPAVGRVGVHERAELLDESLDHRVEAQVARERLAGLQERLLLGQPAVAVTEQPGGIERDRCLAGDGLGERDLRRAPVAHERAVKGEHAEEPVLRDDRRRQHGADTVLGEPADAAERLVFERRGLENVGDGDGAADPRGEIDDREPGRVAERRTPSASHSAATAALSPSLMKQRIASTALPISSSTAGSTSSTSRLERSSTRCRDQSLTFERIGQSDRRARALEREPRFAGESLHPAELVLVEHARTPDRAEHDADHVVPGSNRDETQLLALAIAFSR